MLRPFACSFTVVPRVTENNAYAKFLGAYQVYYGRCAYAKQSVFTLRHGGHFVFQTNPLGLKLFSYVNDICIDAGHVSENVLWALLLYNLAITDHE